jgi:hypothetical protein
MKRIGIEEFAAWAVQCEWPKVHGGDLAPGGVERASILSALGLPLKPRGPAEAGGMDWSVMVAEGAVPALRLSGVPHPDAVLFSQACNELDALAQSVAYDADDCLSDQLAVLEPDANERLDENWRLTSAHLRTRLPNPRKLVLAYAALARAPTAGRPGWTIARPDWHPDPVERRHVRGDGGRGQPAWFVEVKRRVRVSNPGERPAYEVRTFEEEGYCARLKRPKRDAYRKLAFDPDPGFVARERHIHALWWCALEWLAAWLEASRGLSNHQVAGPQGIEKPWQMPSEKAA